jgi:hypothetical protein
MTYIMVYDRVYLLLRDNLTDWWTMNPEPLQQVTSKFHITSSILPFPILLMRFATSPFGGCDS